MAFDAIRKELQRAVCTCYLACPAVALCGGGKVTAACPAVADFLSICRHANSVTCHFPAQHPSTGQVAYSTIELAETPILYYGIGKSFFLLIFVDFFDQLPCTRMLI